MGFSKLFLWTQLVAEGSLEKRRGLDFSVNSKKGSVNQRRKSEQAKGELQYIRKRKPANGNEL